MMASRFVDVLWIALVPALLGGCGTSAPARFYTLDPTAAGNGASSARCAVVVDPVSIPASVDRPQFVVQIAANRVDVDEFNRWVAPLGDQIAGVAAADLAALLGTPNVVTAPIPNLDYRVLINVQRFESVRGQTAVLDAVWTVQKAGNSPPHSGRTSARETVQGDSFEALAAGHSRALATLSADIAAAIREGDGIGR
jgi:uncharacterized lipoprotein YmbA